MQGWTIKEYAAFVSILLTAVSAVVMCARLMFTVKTMELKLEKLEMACEAHRTNGDLHRGKDYERWLEQKFDGLEEKLDDIHKDLHLASINKERKQ